jgi:hypothetical protein
LRNVLISKQFCASDHPIKRLVGDKIRENPLGDAENRGGFVHRIKLDWHGTCALNHEGRR